MNDFLARNSSLQPSRAAERAGRAVLAAQDSASASDHGQKEKAAAALPEGDVETQLSSASEVAEAQAKIAALLSELDGASDVTADLDALERRIAALFPRPVVIVPLPPADPDAVRRAVEIAESIRASALLALSAQANVDAGIAAGALS